MGDGGVASCWHVAIDAVVLLLVPSFLSLTADKRLMTGLAVADVAALGFLGIK